MLHIVLINPRIRTWSPAVWVPLGLTYIAAVLEQEKHNVEIVDLNAVRMKDENLLHKVKSADIVGITGMITEYQEVLRLVGIIKKARYDIKVVLGGPLATTFWQELLQASQADFSVVGEGERTIVNLVSAIEHANDFGDIKGIAYRGNGRIISTAPVEPIDNLDAIPFPARHLLDMNRYLKNHFESFGFKIKDFGKIRSTNLTTSRGCPYSCTFCFKGMWGHKWRGRSPANMIEEMEVLSRTYDVNGFLFTDDTFVLNRKRVLEFCQLIKRKGLDIVWHCTGRVNLMNKELLAAMYDAGCRGVAYGIESGNQQILDLMKKNITLEQIRDVVKWTKEAGINILGYFMLGMLGETKDTIRQTIALAKELALDSNDFNIVAPFPGTELYDASLKRGLIEKDMAQHQDHSFHVNLNLTQDCSDDDLVRYSNEVFKEFTLKRFGKYYFLNPIFLRKMGRVVLSLQRRNEAKQLTRKMWGVIRSYWSQA